MLSIKLDIQIDSTNIRKRLLAPLKWILSIKNKAMNLLSIFRKEEELVKVMPVFIEEFEYFKRDYFRYISKKTIEGVIHLWAHSSVNEEKYFLGIYKDGVWERAGDFHHLSYGMRKRAQLMVIVLEKGLVKPYGFWYTYPALYN